jgi:hypothetical protein
MTTPPDLPAFPKPLDYYSDGAPMGSPAAYERALREAYAARLRALVNACEDAGHVIKGHGTCFICKALDAIGPLPPPPEKG